MGNRFARTSAAASAAVASFETSARREVAERKSRGPQRGCRVGVAVRGWRPRVVGNRKEMTMRHAVLTTVLAALVAAPLGASGASGTSISGSYVEARTAEVFTGDRKSVV